jgi:hypothetical protein
MLRSVRNPVGEEGYIRLIHIKGLCVSTPIDTPVV